MEHIQKIDENLTSLFSGFDKAAQRLNFQLLGDINEVDLDSIQFPGLYFFEVWAPPYGSEQIDEWLSSFKTKWNQEEFKHSFVPSCQKGRMKQHTTVHEWMPLYLGKSKKIGKRVWEHINFSAGQRTFSMKMKARNLLEGNKYRLSVLPLNLVNYSVLAPMLEASLRSKHSPLVGRQ